MTTTAIKTCPTCRHRAAAVSSNERAVTSLARRLCNAQNSDLAPHMQRGLHTQLLKAKEALASSKAMLEDHQYGECEA